MSEKNSGQLVNFVRAPTGQGKLADVNVPLLMADPRFKEVTGVMVQTAALSILIGANPDLMQDPQFATAYKVYQMDVTADASYFNFESTDPTQQLQAGLWSRALSYIGISYVPHAQAQQLFGIDPQSFNPDDGSGYHASLFHLNASSPDSGYILANRGTQGVRDIAVDVYGGTGYVTKQFADGVKLGQQLELKLGTGGITFTGHSLGGGLATAQTLATGAPSYAFDAMGLTPSLYGPLKLNPAYQSRVTEYYLGTDPLNGAQDHSFVSALLSGLNYSTRLESKAHTLTLPWVNDLLTPSSANQVWGEQLESWLMPAGLSPLLTQPINLASAIGNRIKVQPMPGISYSQGHSNVNMMNSLYRDAFYAAGSFGWGH